MGLKQSLQALCFLLSPVTATSAFLLPQGSVRIDHRRFAAGVDDLLDIVTAYQKSRRVDTFQELSLQKGYSLGPTISDASGADVDASKANVMDGFMQAARENFQFTGTTTTVADSDSLRQSIASIRESVQSMKGSIETARESIKDSIDGSTTIIANKVPNESELAASLQSSTGSLRNSLLSIKEAIQDFKESHGSVYPTGGAEARGKAPLLADYIKSGVGIDDTHNSVGSVARSSSNIVANMADKQSAQLAVDDIVRSSGDYIHQSINSLMHTTTGGSGVESAVVAAAKIKLSMMIGNTYMLFGMDPPESLVRSGASISPAFHLFVAFFAVLLALGSKEIGKAQTHNHLQALSRMRNAKVVALDEQMVRKKPALYLRKSSSDFTAHFARLSLFIEFQPFVGDNGCRD
jgi:hypothetical protein